MDLRNNEVFISSEAMRTYRRVYHLNTTVGSCCNILNHYLLPERQITFTQGGTEMSITNDELDKWDSFAVEIFTQIICWGFAIFTDDLRAVAIDDIQHIAMNTTTRELKIELLSTSKQKYGKVFIMNSFGLCPLDDGTIVSTIARVYPSIKFMESILAQAIAIERQKVNPSVLCEASDEKTSKTERNHKVETRHLSVYANSQKTASDAQRELDEAQSLLDSMQDRATTEITREASSGVKTKVSYTALPPGMTISKVIASEGRNDLVSIVRMVDQQICALLGVPRSMLINDSVARADTQATHDCFRVALKRYKKDVTHVMAVATLIKYGTGVEVVLPDSFHGATEELTKMYLLGMIPYERYSRMFCEMYNTSFTTSMDPLSQEQRSQLAMECMQSMVTQHHGRT